MMVSAILNRSHPTIAFVKAILVLGGCLFFSSGAPASGPAENTTVTAGLSRHLKDLKALSGRFVQESYDALQGRKTQASGYFSFKKPGLMRWDYRQPDPLSVIVGERRLWIYDPVLENVIVKKLTDVSQTEMLTFLINPELLDREFVAIVPEVVRLDDASRFHTLYLAQKSGSSDFMELQLAFTPDDYGLRQFVIVDASGGYRKITLSDLVINPVLDTAVFDFAVPDGVEIIDETGN
jgi:outer membrane lipoprotein carrier protein